jgi:monovalent cation/hydrogen antiporter
MSTSLVIAAATGGVAIVGHALGLPWGPAWVLGAALVPTDATAVGVIARALPRATSPCCAPAGLGHAGA